MSVKLMPGLEKERTAFFVALNAENVAEDLEAANLFLFLFFGDFFPTLILSSLGKKKWTLQMTLTQVFLCV